MFKKYSHAWWGIVFFAFMALYFSFEWRSANININDVCVKSSGMTLADVKQAVVNSKLTISSEVNGMHIVHSASNFGRLVCFVKEQH